jgi:hypothetical protein
MEQKTEEARRGHGECQHGLKWRRRVKKVGERELTYLVEGLRPGDDVPCEWTAIYGILRKKCSLCTAMYWFSGNHTPSALAYA